MINRMRLPGATVWIAGILCPLACAQVRVAGRVTNENELPVAGALITIEDVPATRTWEETSDPTGSFSLQLTNPGQYSLKVDREGFYLVKDRLVAVPSTPADGPPFELHVALESIHEIR